MMPWLLPLLGFLVGSIPFGLLIGKAKGIDVREHGSGNIGATNVLRIVGKGPGILCLVLDLLKGFVPVLLAINLVRFGEGHAAIPVPFLQGLSDTYPASEQVFAQSIHILTALATLLGHNYSPWLGFKGGKGIATTGGALIPLMPVAVPILVLVWYVTLRLTRYVSVASMAAAVALPLLTAWGSWYHGKFADGTWNKPLLAFAVFAAGMAVWRHRANIVRLMNGTESKLFPKKKKA
jgi:glycerol-3-phosphate acyltransferase PlsY